MNTAASVTMVLVFMLSKIQYGSFEPPVGEHNISLSFEKMAKKKYFVDKSDLLKEILSDTTTHETTWIITFPKRFGKTTNMQMIKKFAEIEVNANGSILAQDFNNVTDTPNYEFFNQKYNFGHFNITNDKDFMREHFGRYPVIHMDFKSISLESGDDVIAHCQRKIRDAFLQHRYLRNSENLDNVDKKIIQSWIETSDEIQPKREVLNSIKKVIEFQNLNSNNSENLLYDDKKLILSWIETSNRTEAQTKVINGLKELIELVHKHFKQPIIVLIDEYDAIIQRYLLGKSIQNELLENIYIPFVDMLSNALKDQPKVKVALLTGVTYISSAGFTTNLPLKKHRFAREKKFWKYYGFTSEELNRLFSISRFKDNSTVQNDVQKYYDGYLVNDMHIYTPLSIQTFFIKEKIKAFWNMETHGIISEFWRSLRIVEIRSKMAILLGNQHQHVMINNMESVKVSDIMLLKQILQTNSLKADTTGEATNIFFNLILDLGYLKITWQNDTHLNVSIPNSEICEEMTELFDTYKSKIHHDKEFRLQGEFSQHLQSLTANDQISHLQEITNALNELSRLHMAFYTYVKEQDLKNMLILAFAFQDIPFYSEVYVEKPRGDDLILRHGFIDLLITHLSNVYVIIETKYEVNSSAALHETNDYVLVLDQPGFEPTQNCILQLGINMDDNREITVSALLNTTNGNSYGPYHFTALTSTTTINSFNHEYTLNETRPLRKRKKTVK